MGIQDRDGGAIPQVLAPQINYPCLQLSKEIGSWKELWFLSSAYISQMGKQAVVQVTRSDSGKAKLAFQVP